MTTETLLIDGNNMIAMNAHAHASLTDPNGVPTGAIYGTLLRLRSLMLQEIEETVGRVVFVLDAGRPAFRKRLCPEYKANRKRDDDDPFVVAYKTQLGTITSVLSSLNVIVVKSPGYEADDVIAGLSGQYRPCVIVSNDRDLLQLVRKSVRVYRTGSHSMISEIEPGYLLARCIQGDTSDAIKGVPGLGEKRSWEVVRNHGDRPVFTKPSVLLEGYEGKYAAKIKEHAKTIERNWKIMRLRKTGRLSLENLKVVEGAFDAKKFKKYLVAAGMRSILSEGSRFTTMFERLNPCL